MEITIDKSEYVHEVNWNEIKLYQLHWCRNNLLWSAVEELLKDNKLWDGYQYYVENDNTDNLDVYFRHAKRIYNLTKSLCDSNNLKNKNQKNLLNSEESLNKYSRNKKSIILPLDGYIIILLKNDNVIVGGHGIPDLDNCYYYNDFKQIPFDKLDGPFKRLIIEKLLEEKEQGKNMNNLLHLLPK